MSWYGIDAASTGGKFWNSGVGGGLLSSHRAHCRLPSLPPALWQLGPPPPLPFSSMMLPSSNLDACRPATHRDSAATSMPPPAPQLPGRGHTNLFRPAHQGHPSQHSPSNNGAWSNFLSVLFQQEHARSMLSYQAMAATANRGANTAAGRILGGPKCGSAPNFHQPSMQHMANGMCNPAGVGSTGPYAGANGGRTQHRGSCFTGGMNVSGGVGGVSGATQHSKLGENIMARLCMHRIRLMGPRWYKAVSHIRVGKKKKEKKRVFHDQDYVRLDEAKAIALDMIPEDLVDIAGNLLKKVFKEVQEESKELLILTWLSDCTAATRHDSGHGQHDRCVFTQPDGKGKMKRIDGLRGSDKVWRLDTLVAILYHGIPMDSTDTNLLVHRCEEELCINPHHFMFQCSPAMVAVVSEMLKLRGFQVVQSDPLLEGGAQATDRDKGNFQFTSPFSISTLQREIHENLLFPPSALEKYTLSAEDVTFVQKQLSKDWVKKVNLSNASTFSYKDSLKASSVSKKEVDDDFNSTLSSNCTALVESPSSLEQHQKETNLESTCQLQRQFLTCSSEWSLNSNTQSPEINCEKHQNQVDCQVTIVNGCDHSGNTAPMKRLPLNASPDNQMPIKKRRMMSNCDESLNLPINGINKKFESNSSLPTDEHDELDVEFHYERKSASVLQLVGEKISTMESCEDVDAEEDEDDDFSQASSVMSSTTPDSVIISAIKEEVEEEESSLLNMESRDRDEGMPDVSKTNECNAFSTSSVANKHDTNGMEHAAANNRTERELQHRFQQQQQQYLAAWHNIMSSRSRSPHASSPLNFWPSQVSTTNQPTLLNVNNWPTLVRPKPRGAQNPDANATFQEAAGLQRADFESLKSADCNALTAAMSATTDYADTYVPIQAQTNGSESLMAHQQMFLAAAAAAAAAATAHSHAFTPLSSRLTPMMVDDYMKLNCQRSNNSQRDFDELTHFLRNQSGSNFPRTNLVAGGNSELLTKSLSSKSHTNSFNQSQTVHQQLSYQNKHGRNVNRGRNLNTLHQQQCLNNDFRS